MTVTVETIRSDSDIEAVARFLHEHLNPGITPEAWARSFDYPWMPDRPNNGFRLMDGPRLVGVLVGYYSERRLGTRSVKCCNLSSWCVLPDYRAHSFSLIRRMLAQSDYQFIDLTPTDQVIRISSRLNFKRVDSDRILVPHLPLPLRRGLKVSKPDELPATALSERARAIFEDHRTLPSISHLAIGRPPDYCYIIYAKQRRKGVPCAVIRHVEPRESLSDYLPYLGGYLLFHEGLLASVVEERFLLRRPFCSIKLARPSCKFYRGAALEPGDIDNLYSEVVLLPIGP